MVQDLVHTQIVKHLNDVKSWFRHRRGGLPIPFYSSYDIRDSGFKVTNVDANIYPAGFNNICPTDRENGGALIKSYIKDHYGSEYKNILILTEEHTQNPYYWENVKALRQLIEDGGFEVRLAVPRGQPCEPMRMQAASGEEIEVFAVIVKEGRVSGCGFEPDLIVSNNDFSISYPELGPQIITPMNPPRELGWYQRKKSTYFQFYNELAREFAEVIKVDPWLFTVHTELMDHFDLGQDSSRDELARRVDTMIESIRAKYATHGINEEPFVFIKNNSGTYGLGVMRVSSGSEVMSLNYKSRKKMKAAKGGRDVEEVILQEGVATRVTTAGSTAEPTIYMVGCQLLGGFLRTHGEKGPTESLNSPGAVYKRMCVSDLNISVEGHPLENVYGWVASLGVLAIGREANAMKVQFNGYHAGGDCDR